MSTNLAYFHHDNLLFIQAGHRFATQIHWDSDYEIVLISPNGIPRIILSGQYLGNDGASHPSQPWVIWRDSSSKPSTTYKRKTDWWRRPVDDGARCWCVLVRIFMGTTMYASQQPASGSSIRFEWPWLLRGCAARIEENCCRIPNDGIPYQIIFKRSNHLNMEWNSPALTDSCVKHCNT